MEHDWIRFPELTNAQLGELEFQSPHKQITEDFHATVVKVHDGDTITLRVDWRDFDFPLRFLNTDAPELGEPGGYECQEWLEGILLNEEVDIIIKRIQRVDKWGRLLGIVVHRGIDINEQSMQMGWAKPFDQRHEAELPNLNKELNIAQWL
jgi:endonuclease YncB( thermonuclease family)